MSYNLDVDEADVAVLNQNLIRSKELFESIGKSLHKISTKSQTASSTINPVLKQVNQLTTNKHEVENGLKLLQEVSENASKINDLENLLNNSIENSPGGIKSYLINLNQSKNLLSQIKTQSKFKQFKGILYNFENLIDRSETKVQKYYQDLINGKDSRAIIDKRDEIKLIFQYFSNPQTKSTSNSGGNEEYVTKLYVRARSKRLIEKLKPIESSTKPAVKANANIPYEKGTNGITKYTDVLSGEIEQELIILNECQLSTHLIGPIVEESISRYNGIINKYNQVYFKTPQEIVDNVILILEVLNNLIDFKVKLKQIGLNRTLEQSNFINTFEQYLETNSVIFKEFIQAIDNRFQNLGKFNEINTQEVIVELMSKLRRLSEFKLALLQLIKNYSIGQWLVSQPPMRFVNVFSSVIPNSQPQANSDGEEDEVIQEYLLSSFYSDVIDAIMINIEIGLKKNTSGGDSLPSSSSTSASTNATSGTSSLSLNKKSTQGFILIKNLFMLESIVNRSQYLYQSLGSLGEERILRLKNRFLKLFLDDWSHASYIIIRDMTTIATQSAQHQQSQQQSSNTIGTGGGTVTNLSNKEKDQVKDLFKNFNESFEEALFNYQKYNFGDAILKKYLSNEIKKLILNTYFKLYDKYGNSDFTKNKSKYVKYDKLNFEKLLNERL
ncbi:exocyst complex protein EXO70 [Candida albicans P57072]|uniref:Exocyst complex protein EXO70 n=2 Tax=Candida albicans TaxID=5476 RepID=EXO70_CANAL|nr:GTP-Rho binding exocyst subunit [Candida albicans SC5314]Q5AH25.1 RecName: Full=Exocyst complex protein EXO70 [Candida albicans SC5314]KGR03144.1 exocyst complex protein EXO70 [Candida albicans P57072]KGR05174.1 exocyst complex protein EXO70 [Candida albicans P78048]KGR09349.1 exocyst complex protein EXO70 [Candida albicans P37037]KGT65210.1 exocyst complex protein EXO70 [Candida albicans 12C]KGU04407.1 exocyst complex protein EXO70 [Candida albicans 19F]KGU04559.1 exocyst complex protein|eukprot:XP_721350.1 GTP-Rho binding exocyst subunit [Candida albicans SC5314]